MGNDQWTEGEMVSKEARAQIMRARIEAHNAPTTYTFGG